MENAVEKAIRILGGSLQATIKTHIPPTTFWKWAKAGRIKDGARAVLVSRATGGQVSVEELVGFTNGASPNGGGQEDRSGSSRTCSESREVDAASPLNDAPFACAA